MMSSKKMIFCLDSFHDSFSAISTPIFPRRYGEFKHQCEAIRLFVFWGPIVSKFFACGHKEEGAVLVFLLQNSFHADMDEQADAPDLSVVEARCRMRFDRSAEH